MAVKRRTTESSSTPFAWSTENELKLFKAALKFKPAGLMKHFNMALIHNELVKSGLKDVSPAEIWNHLSLMFNLEEADRLEKTASNLDDGETEFVLPKKEFQDVIAEMKLNEESGVTREEVLKKSAGTSASETPKSSGIKRPLRSTPGSGASSAKRRK